GARPQRGTSGLPLRISAARSLQGERRMSFEALVADLALAVEVAGIAILLLGAVAASGVFLREWVRLGFGESYHRYRANLGRAILLGLEVLIIADIVGTVAVEPTMDNLIVLGLIVLIRTFLSLALQVEISGQLPWRRGPSGAPHQAESQEPRESAG